MFFTNGRKYRLNALNTIFANKNQRKHAKTLLTMDDLP